MKNILGYNWKTQQTRRDNVERVCEVIGIQKDQDRMYCSHPVKGKYVVFHYNSPAHISLKNNNLLDMLFIPVFE